MKKQLLLLPLIALVLVTQGHAGVSEKTDRMRERLLGPVRTVLVEIATIEKQGGEYVELPRIPWTSTEYNREGARIVEDQLYKNTTLDFKSVFTYDAAGKLQEGLETDARGALTFKWSYTHTPAEGKIEERRSHPDGSLFSTTTYSYDKDGNLIKEMHFPPHTKNHFRWVMRYDPQGRKQAESHTLLHPDKRTGKVKEILKFHTVFSYDQKGVLIREVRHDGAGKLEWDKRYEYKYDKKGNWVYQKAFEPRDPSQGVSTLPTGITYRTISYFQN